MAAITISEFCGLEKVSRQTWHRLVKRRTAPRHYRIGRAVRIQQSDYQAWHERMKRKAAQS
jgi:excisionase family DNA binding protein